jgi:ADP-ribose pyrophosphatase YjhB (NUDIX family)
MSKINLITNKKIQKVLESISRQYLVGNLTKEQVLPFFFDERLEIGISKYDDFKNELCHYHTTATEYQYILSGYTEYIDIKTKEVYAFQKGDFYQIESNTIYGQKVKKNTEILFIKVPSINDKVVCEVDDAIQTWLNSPIKSKRIDYYYDNNSPVANSIVPAAACVIVEDNRLLLVKRQDNDYWTMPGGTIEFGESLEECAIREIKEETGLEVRLEEIIKIYSDPNVKIAYLDGEVRQEFTVLYYASTLGSTKVMLDNESTEFKWQDLNDLNFDDFTKAQARRIHDTVLFLKNKEK